MVATKQLFFTYSPVYKFIIYFEVNYVQDNFKIKEIKIDVLNVIRSNKNERMK